MPFVPTDLSLQANAAGHSWWHYISVVDTTAVITGGNYFGAAANVINAGDFMAINGSNGNAIAMVASSDGNSNVGIGTPTPMGDFTPSAPPPPPGNGETEGEPPPPPETVSHGRQRASR